jgi:hypothetical protein
MPATRSSSRRNQKSRQKKPRNNDQLFDNAIPSLRLLQNVPSHDNVTHSNDQGDSDLFQPGDW